MVSSGGEGEECANEESRRKKDFKKGDVHVVMAIEEHQQEVVVRKVGNSKGLTLPKISSAEIGDRFFLVQKADGTLILKPLRRPKRIKNVFADLDYSAYSDLEEEIVPFVGKESD